MVMVNPSQKFAVDGRALFVSHTSTTVFWLQPVDNQTMVEKPAYPFSGHDVH
jgi:hypothetical protein